MIKKQLKTGWEDSRGGKWCSDVTSSGEEWWAAEVLQWRSRWWSDWRYLWSASARALFLSFSFSCSHSAITRGNRKILGKAAASCSALRAWNCCCQGKSAMWSTWAVSVTWLPLQLSARGYNPSAYRDQAGHVNVQRDRDHDKWKDTHVIQRHSSTYLKIHIA